MRSIITVIGKDRVGIISGVSNVLAENGVNILDISQTIMQEYFTMIMLVNISGAKVSFDELREKLNQKGEQLGVSIKVQNEDIFNSMNRV